LGRTGSGSGRAWSADRRKLPSSSPIIGSRPDLRPRRPTSAERWLPEGGHAEKTTAKSFPASAAQISQKFAIRHWRTRRRIPRKAVGEAKTFFAHARATPFGRRRG
jgi:hypothetical protein